MFHLFPAADTGKLLGDFRPDWGPMSFLIDFLRPSESDGPWYNLLKNAGGGCNDLVYSGHMLVAVLTAMAWTVLPIMCFEICGHCHLMSKMQPTCAVDC